MKIVAILQARMGSTRLPGKVMLPLAGKPMLQNIIERVQRSQYIQKVMVTCPIDDAEIFLPIIQSCRDDRHQVYLDSWFDDPDDVVGRYHQAATIASADLIVRVPCDNPCIDPPFIDAAIHSYLTRPQIYVSTMYPCWNGGTYLDGVGAEVFSMSRLQWLDQATKGRPQYREHPHLLFQDQGLIEGWNQYTRYADMSQTIRLDVNTQADYEFIKTIYDHFGHNRFTTEDVVQLLASTRVS